MLLMRDQGFGLGPLMLMMRAFGSKDEPHDEPPNEVPRSEAGLAAFPAAPLLKQGLQATARLGRGITGRTLSVGDRSLPDLNVIPGQPSPSACALWVLRRAAACKPCLSNGATGNAAAGVSRPFPAVEGTRVRIRPAS